MPVVKDLNFFKLQDIWYIMNCDSLANIRNDWSKKGNRVTNPEAAHFILCQVGEVCSITIDFFLW